MPAQSSSRNPYRSLTAIRWRLCASGCTRPSIGSSPRRSGSWRRALPTALLSVSDKTGLAAFARGLKRLGYDLFATGTTLQAIEDAALDVQAVSELTGLPEMMDGRIKTLHPGVHAGILARRDKQEHVDALAEHGLRQIDLVCCNLYPFVQTVLRPGVTPEEAIEQIDIGGPAMIRGAGKKHEAGVVGVRPPRYSEGLRGRHEGRPGPPARHALAPE